MHGPSRLPGGWGGWLRLVSRRAAVLGGLILVLLSCSVTWGLARGWDAPRSERAALRQLEPGAAFANLVRGLALIQDAYVSAPDMAHLEQAALQAAVAALGDPYSAYLTPAQYQALRSGASGRYTGIGVQVEQSGTGPVVTRVFAGSPAAITPYTGEAPGQAPGLRPGDRLVAVDGVQVAGLDAADVRARIAGPSGSRVTVVVERSVAASGGAAPSSTPEPGAGLGVPLPPPGSPGVLLTFPLVRQVVDARSVTWRLLAGGVGYLAIQMFNARTPLEVARGLTALRASGARALVLDLRDNPGGVVAAAVQVARYLLPGGVLAYVLPRSGPRQALAVPAPRPLGLPLAVLIDGQTASAAEMLAGAVQDDHAGVLVGEPTYGKGVVQRVYPLAGGAALKLTIARYLTPNGRALPAGGLIPDVRVPAPASGVVPGDPAADPQLAAAIARLRAGAAA